MKRARVWIVSPAPWARGGVAAVTRQLADSSLRERYELRVLSTYAGGSAATRLAWAARGLVAVAWGLATRRPDLVHVKVASRGSFYRKLAVTALSRLFGVPVIVHVHGGGFDEFVASSPAPVRRLAAWMIEETPLALTLSEARLERLRPLFPRARWEVVANPVEVAAHRPLVEERRARRGAPGAPRRLLFLGDVLERKGVGILLQALAELPSPWAGVTLTVAGPGDLERYRRLAEDLGVLDRVEFAGWVDSERKRALFVAADVFVLPSFVEGVPVALLEAMAAGLPSIVTPVGGVLDAAVPEETSLVVPPGDVAALRGALVRLLAAEDLAERLAAGSLARAAAFDVEIIAGRLDELYRAVLAERSRPTPEAA